MHGSKWPIMFARIVFARASLAEILLCGCLYRMRGRLQWITDAAQGQRLPISSLSVAPGKTSPPAYLTEAELIGIMEREGVGTDASIATHIENVCKRGYVAVGKGRTMVPTSLGIVLVQGCASGLLEHTAISLLVFPSLSLPRPLSLSLCLSALVLSL